MIDNQIPEGE